MSAEIVPFEFARCVGRIRRTALATLGMSHAAAEKHIELQIRRLWENLIAKGVDPCAAADQAKAYHAALRAQIWRLTLTGDGETA